MRLVGITKAKEINYSGRQVKADEALDIGLVSGVFSDEDCYPEAIKAAEIYAKGPKSLQYIKRSMMEGLALPLQDAIKVEAEAFGDCFETEDRLIGVQSFLEHGPGKADFNRK
jgi:enoyl-CoA hydratase/carnithine racemase